LFYQSIEIYQIQVIEAEAFKEELTRQLAAGAFDPGKAFKAWAVPLAWLCLWLEVPASEEVAFAFVASLDPAHLEDLPLLEALLTQFLAEQFGCSCYFFSSILQEEATS